MFVRHENGGRRRMANDREFILISRRLRRKVNISPSENWIFTQSDFKHEIHDIKKITPPN